MNILSRLHVAKISVHIFKRHKVQLPLMDNELFLRQPRLEPINKNDGRLRGQNWSAVRDRGASASRQTNQLTAAWQAGLAHAQWLTVVWNMAASWSPLRENGASEQLQHQSGTNRKEPTALRGVWGAEERLRIPPRNHFTGKFPRCRMPLGLIHLPRC